MIREAIEFNLHRLQSFLGDTHKHVIPLEWNDFLHLYARILDYHGAGREQYTLLLFTSEDYEEFKKFSISFQGFKVREDFKSDNAPTGPSVSSSGYTSFLFQSYIWRVKEIKEYPTTINQILSQLKHNISCWEKCETIDEKIANCTKHCHTEYDECCVKWKEHWSQYDEGLKVAIQEIDNLLTQPLVQ